MSTGLQILSKKVILYTLVFLLLVGIYIFELNWWAKKMADLKDQYQRKIELSLKTAELITRKRAIEDLTKKLQEELGFSLEEANQTLQANLPYLEKEKIKEVLTKKWSVTWQQTSPGKPPEAVMTLAPGDLPAFFQFLQAEKISFEVTDFKLEHQGDEVKLTFNFAY